ENKVGLEVREAAVVEAVAVRDRAFDARNGEVHLRQAPGHVSFFAKFYLMRLLPRAGLGRLRLVNFLKEAQLNRTAWASSSCVSKASTEANQGLLISGRTR